MYVALVKPKMWMRINEIIVVSLSISVLELKLRYRFSPREKSLLGIELCAFPYNVAILQLFYVSGTCTMSIEIFVLIWQHCSNDDESLPKCATYFQNDHPVYSRPTIWLLSDGLHWTKRVRVRFRTMTSDCNGFSLTLIGSRSSYIDNTMHGDQDQAATDIGVEGRYGYEVIMARMSDCK